MFRLCKQLTKVWAPFLINCKLSNCWCKAKSKNKRKSQMCDSLLLPNKYNTGGARAKNHKMGAKPKNE
uniref:Secreted protein n=1 Tax=Romanomermis culicivorax TaxID=13658 RepID=A0A915HNF2_ROMCU